MQYCRVHRLYRSLRVVVLHLLTLSSHTRISPRRRHASTHNLANASASSTTAQSRAVKHATYIIARASWYCIKRTTTHHTLISSRKMHKRASRTTYALSRAGHHGATILHSMLRVANRRSSKLPCVLHKLLSRILPLAFDATSKRLSPFHHARVTAGLLESLGRPHCGPVQL